MSNSLLKEQQTATDSFLASHAINPSTKTLVGQDTSSRRYWRYDWNGKKIILMECVPDESHNSLSGNKTQDFVRLSKFLQQKGIRTPQIFAEDHRHGLVLLEDFGSTTFKQKSLTSPNE